MVSSRNSSRRIRATVGLLSAALIALLGIREAAYAVSTDVDQDGRSDLILVAITNPALTWNAQNVSDGLTRQIATAGVNGNDLIFGDFLGLGSPQVGITLFDTRRSKIRWTVTTMEGQSKNEYLGESGDLVLGGADLDGNGQLDRIVVSPGSGLRGWSFRTGAFGSGAPVTTMQFGSKKELPFFFNVDGAGDRLAVLRRRGDGHFVVKTINPVDQATRRFAGKKWFGKRGSKARPLPLQSKEGKDILVVADSSSSGTQFTLFYPNARRLKTRTIKARGTVVVGDYNADGAEEVAVHRKGTLTIFDPWKGKVRTMRVGTGVAVDEINTNVIKGVSNGGGGNNGGGNDDDDDDDQGGAPPTNAPASLDSVCAARSGILPGQMLIKSEISDHINLGDPRATGYTLVCGSQCPRNLSLNNFFYSDGSYAGSVAYYGTFSGNGKPRLYGATGQAPQHFVSEIASKAARIGNGKLYMQMSRATSGPDTECKEFNTRGRNGDV